MNIRQKIVQGFTWVILAEFLSQGLQFITAVILARLLLPEHFGIIATAYLYIKSIQVLQQSFGLPEAIVQGSDTDNRRIATAFVTYIFTGLGFSSLTFIIAPLAARFFNVPALGAILKVLSITFVFDSATYIFEAVISRRLDYKEAAFPRLAGVIAYGVIGAISAFLGCGVWSLVWALLFNSAARCLLAWKLSRWELSFSFAGPSLKKMLGFGKGVFWGTLIHYIGSSADFLIIGKFLGPGQLGYYAFAYSISNYFYNYMTPVFFKVLFPAFSRLHDENGLFKDFYLKVIHNASLLSIPLSLGICVNAREFVLFLFGAKWSAAVVPLQILCVNGLLKTFYKGTTKAVVYAKNRADLSWKLGILYCAGNYTAILIGFRYGIIGIAMGVTIAEIVYLSWAVLKTNALIDLPLKTYVQNIKPVLFASAIMIFALWYMNTWLPLKIGYFFLKVIVAGIIYILSLKAMRIDLWLKIKFFYRMAAV